MIAIDWGTSNFRAFRLNQEGEIVDRRSSRDGILHVAERRFAEILHTHLADWFAAGENRLVLCGMIGSRQGWKETEYLTCPVGIEDLAKAAARISFSAADVRLVPGVAGVDSSGIPELMRGEETEAMGVLGMRNFGGLICMPGTHSKWVRFADQRIVSFSTCMTGDVFSALRKCSILAGSTILDVPVQKEAFLHGVARSADAGGLLHHLFSVRTLVLSNQLEENASASYLSGLLIGHEIRTTVPSGTHIHLVGDPSLCSLYMQAITACGSSSTLEDRDAAARGLAAIARRISWT